MQMYDLINKKRHGLSLSREEIYWIVENYTNEVIPDYQMSAFLMAVCFASMNEEETADLTMAMAHSGDMLDLSSFGGFTVDKHSTGGVGDKTTLIIGPIVASYGIKVPKMSGRGLGHTGGTIDKLESIPGFKTALSFEEFSDAVKKCGLAVVGQTAHLAPADKKIYALRDITATVESIPLISSSIMSKKLATGANGIVLDIKVGSGAFMKKIDDARKLAESMTKTAHLAGRKCKAIITNMDKPLGRAIGNSLEVIEAIEVLKNNVRGDLYDICIELSADMLSLSGMASVEECRLLAKKAIENGTALQKFKEMIKLQGGNEKVTDDYGLFKTPTHKYEIKANKSGYISTINCEECGICALMLGAGRAVKNADIDHSAGIILNKLLGDKVESGEVIAVFYTSQNISISEIEQKFLSSYSISDKVEKNFGIII